MYKLTLFFEKYLAFLLLHLLRVTYQYKITGLQRPYPHAIYAFWHRYIVPIVISRRNENAVIVISSSKDGDYIAEPAKLLGYQPVRGSSTRKGTSALKQMIALASQYTIGITPDGPKGPAHVVKEGVLQLAYLTKLPLYAISVSVSKAWVFNSWDRFVLPKPFAKINVHYSEPIYITQKEDFEEKKSELTQQMRD